MSTTLAAPAPPVSPVRRSRRGPALALAFGGAVAATWITAAVLAAGRGYDLTDEGFYLLSYRWWAVDHRSFTGVAYIYGPVFDLLGHDVAGLRLIRVATIAGAHLLFGWAFMTWLRRRRPAAPPTRLWEAAGATAVLAAGGVTYSWLPATPGYNDVVLLGAMLGLAAVCVLGPRTWPTSVLGAVAVPVLLTKWAAVSVLLPVLLAAVVVLFRYGFPHLVRAAGWCMGGFATAAALVHLLIVPLNVALPPLIEVNRLLAASSFAVPVLLERYWTTTRPTLGETVHYYGLLLLALTALVHLRPVRRLALPARRLARVADHVRRLALPGWRLELRGRRLARLADPGRRVADPVQDSTGPVRLSADPVRRPGTIPAARAGEADAYLCSEQRSSRVLAGVLIALGVAGFAVAARHTATAGGLGGGSANAEHFLAPAVAIVLAGLLTIRGDRLFLALLAVVPLAYAFGTSNAPLKISINALGVWFAVLIAALTALPPAHRAPRLAPSHPARRASSHSVARRASGRPGAARRGDRGWPDRFVQHRGRWFLAAPLPRPPQRPGHRTRTGCPRTGLPAPRPGQRPALRHRPRSPGPLPGPARTPDHRPGQDARPGLRPGWPHRG
jgi:hypothetical protein